MSATPRTAWIRRRIPGGNREGVALIIVLAFVVLLTGLIIAFFSRSLLDRQISNSSVSKGKVSAFADGVTDSIIGELKQEIVLSSSATTVSAGSVTSGTIYTPLTPAGMLPQVSGTIGITGTGLAAPNNLLKVSGSGQLFYVGSGGTNIPSGGSNVIAVSSTTPSLNGRYFTPAYWNEHYLLPTGTNTDGTPIPTSFVPPSWVLVARDGSNPTPTTLTSGMTASGTDPVVGRYAFAIYHEGGLLDVNAVGYPVGTGSAAVIPNAAYKPALAYADLTQLPGGLTTATIDKLVAWRNFASIPVPGSSFLTPSFTGTSGSNYFNLVVSNTTGFLGVSGTALNTNTPSASGQYQSDQMFTSRQELIKFFQNALGVTGTSLNALNYLTTFSRDINQPSIVPDPKKIAAAPILSGTGGGNDGYGGDSLSLVSGTGDARINPLFLAIRVSGTGGWKRNNGSTAVAGEPLVKKRFALNRLAWITYVGASANHMSDPTVQQTITALGGNPANPNDPVYQFLNQGTDDGTGHGNIANYFGLTWDSTNSRWKYIHGRSGYGSPIATLNQVAALSGTNAREADFFEILKASLCAGSLAKAYNYTSTQPPNALTPSGYQEERDNSIDAHVIQIGLNIIDQFAYDNYPKRIVFNDGSLFGGLDQEYRGVEDLPYLYRVREAKVMMQDSIPSQASLPAVSGTGAGAGYTPVALTGSGLGADLQEPEIWNPHALAASSTNPGPTSFQMIAVTGDPNNQITGTYKVGVEWRPQTERRRPGNQLQAPPCQGYFLFPSRRPGPTCSGSRRFWQSPTCRPAAPCRAQSMLAYIRQRSTRPMECITRPAGQMSNLPVF